MQDIFLVCLTQGHKQLTFSFNSNILILDLYHFSDATSSTQTSVFVPLGA